MINPVLFFVHASLKDFIYFIGQSIRKCIDEFTD